MSTTSQLNELNKLYERPWGSYQTLALETGFQIKILTINPQGKLSLQKHFKRSEHWVVVVGQPTITIDDSIRTYQVNDSVYIPQESVHRIENLTTELCKIVEVQVGHYLGEDDIVRLEDVYGRT